MRFRVVEDIVNDLDIKHSNQEYTSHRTSINSSKLPAIFKLVKFRPKTVNLDYGGGRFDNATNWLCELDVTNLIYDPFNRSAEHNSFVLSEIKKNGGADTATLSNVLNVVKEEKQQTGGVDIQVQHRMRPNALRYADEWQKPREKQKAHSQQEAHYGRKEGQLPHSFGMVHRRNQQTPYTG